MKYVAILINILLIGSVAFANEGGHGGNQVEQFIWRLITFIVFVFILYKFLKNPIKNLLINRTEEIRKTIEEAEKAKAEAEKELNTYKEKLASMEKELEQMKNNAIAAVEKEKELILADAEKNIEKLKVFAENLIDSEMTKAKEELKALTVELAIKLAEEKMNTTLTKEMKEKIAEKYIKTLEV
ncbi:ATP synthase F0 subunit B [Deferribacter thermophilus]|uniref:F0F1 ATP synthase subunit B family protein n=1 Tax=Deferribacter thermophilus TaxID=53573 RepID=UPI003C29DF66